ncbi:mycothiol synthase [Spelaeicoccus albus]|uniref:Mycothiol acetyltransferase n=1 Tax=Spelaeicoccus albus TaxID=1280376 RepID=A0A7Z0A7U1_9MICO|nr:mycothiol synthase [Spelaeicoccus albus]NYI66037.1 mycothiol synthase [Spelaeicoccus albus]
MRATIRQSASDLTAEHDAFLDDCTRTDGAAPIGDGLRNALKRQTEAAKAARKTGGKSARDGRAEQAPSTAGTSVFELRAGAAGELAGLAVLGPDGERLTAELAVGPASRTRGFGRRLTESVLAAAADRPASDTTGGETPGGGGEPWFWAHGDHPGAARLAEIFGMRRARELVQMRLRAADAKLPEPQLPSGVHLRAFRPGADDAEWLRVNNAAFSWHPEQGGQTAEDLEAAARQDDFDPDGFFLAVPDDDPCRILGFHWTKVHPGPDRLGEVFVLGVDPGVHSRGLGRALTLAGLNYLIRLGIREIELYTEGDNEKALGLYKSLGFHLHATDVSYTRGHDRV